MPDGIHIEEGSTAIAVFVLAIGFEEDVGVGRQDVVREKGDVARFVGSDLREASAELGK